MALFFGTHVMRIDRKGRVSVPAPFRAALAGQVFQGIVAVPSFKHPAVECGGMEWMERLSAGINDLDVFSEAQDDLKATLFADARELTFDGEGRVMLPDALLAHAAITAEAAFVGMSKTFEIWEPVAFNDHKASARQRTLAERRTLPPRKEGA